MIPQAIRSAVRDFAREHGLLKPGPIVVAVSGGTDSTALLLLLTDLRDELGLVLHVAHFDHRARPRAAAAETQHVADLAARCDAPFHTGRTASKPRSEDDARNARYAFLRRVAAEIGATAIATGHTRDDQAETVLLHLARGAGLAGLGGMRPAHEGIVRPMLAIGRADTASICAAGGVTPLEDPSNRSLRFARNRVRRRVLPELAAINPRVADALARIAESAAADAAALESLAARALGRAGGHGGLSLDALDEATERIEVLRLRALALGWQRAGGGALDARHRAALGAFAARRDGSASLDLPGGRVSREYDRLRYTLVDDVSATVAADPPAVALTANAPADWLGWRFLLTDQPQPQASRSVFVTEVPIGLTQGLIVRGRRPGDRMAPPARTKVQDILVDGKVPAALRPRQPLLVGPGNNVLWVVGLRAVPAPPGASVVVQATPPGPELDPGGHHFWSSRVPGNSIESVMRRTSAAHRKGTGHEPG